MGGRLLRPPMPNKPLEVTLPRLTIAGLGAVNRESQLGKSVGTHLPLVELRKPQVSKWAAIYGMHPRCNLHLHGTTSTTATVNNNAALLGWFTPPPRKAVAMAALLAPCINHDVVAGQWRGAIS